MSKLSDNLVYLDHAAHFPPSEAGGKPQNPLATNINPHAGNRFSEELLACIQNGERRLLAQFGATEFDAEVVWTSGGTESNNLAVLGSLRSFSEPLSLLDATAHKALLAPARAYAKEQGACVEVPVDRHGALQWEQCENGAGNAVLVGVCHVNNETGAIQNLLELRAWLDRHAPNACLLVDALQSFGKVEIPWQAAKVDLLSIGGRKIGGPGHVGALLVRRGLPLQPLMFGGDQQRGMRPGTLDAPGILGFLEVAQDACSEREANLRHALRLKRHLDERLRHEEWPAGAVVPISPPSASPYIFSFALPGFEGAILARSLARRNIVVGTGSACSAEGGGISHVMQAMQVPEQIARGVLRVSFGHRTTVADLDRLVENLKTIVKEY